jgi:hypothetical protein
MTQDGAAAQSQQLRDAVLVVLAAAAASGGTLPEPFHRALEGLHKALHGDGAQLIEAGRPIRDPFEHYLTSLHYTGTVGRPITLEERASEVRRWLDNDAGIDYDPERNVTVTELRAMVIGGLLEELAARLSPGAAFGPGRNGEALAHVCLDLSRELLRQTFVGPQ